MAKIVNSLTLDAEVVTLSGFYEADVLSHFALR